MTKWTEPQRHAINFTAGEAIVAASAGSGKTSVLIERAIRLIRAQQADVDQLLIVTFTEDAADQLKQRLREALDQAYRKAARVEDREFLFHQILLLDRAQISTIHSFSLNVLRENHHLMGLGADIKVFNPEEAALLKYRVLDALFEEWYAAEDAFGGRFRELVDLYGGRQVDQGLADAVHGIQGFLASLSDPAAWLERTRHNYAQIAQEGVDFGSHEAGRYLARSWAEELARIADQVVGLTARARSNGVEAVAAHLEQVLGLVDAARAALERSDWLQLGKTLSLSLPRWPTIKTDSPLRAASEQVKSAFEPVRKDFKDLMDEATTLLSPETAALMREQLPLIETLLEMVERFGQQLAEEKRLAGRLEFDDLQRLAAEALKRPRMGAGSGTVAERYQRRYQYVMVDEYQDVNELQDAIVRSVCRTNDEGCGTNLLVVGDVKQSIYRFRLAEPTIFQSLCQAASGDGAAVRRIDLRENFRSRRETIDAVNGVFERLLVGGALELEYDERSQLVCAAAFAEGETPHYQTELKIIERRIEPNGDENGETGDVADMEATEREAYLVAKRIRELLDSQLPIAGPDGARPIVEEDIVILMRTMRHTAGVFIRMLRQFGISAYCQQVEAFLEYPEIADMVSLLAMIDNPYQDIPLVTLLRSPLVGMGADDLARIRLASKGPFYRAMRAYEHKAAADDATGEKVRQFVKLLERLRRCAAEMTVPELVQAAYHETGYRELAEAQSPGKHVRDNLEQFLELSRHFDGDRRHDLSDFLDYLSLIRESGEPISSITSGGGSGVRIMSIHASKGLEFPVVVLSGVGREINLQDIRRGILVDRDLTIGLRLVDRRDGQRLASPAVRAVERSKYDKTIAEELRLLYVGMTRAEEKLIITGNARTAELARVVEAAGAAGPSAALVKRYRSPLAWIVLALTHSGGGDALTQLLTGEESARERIGPLELQVVPAVVQAGWETPKAPSARQYDRASRNIMEAASNGQIPQPKTPDRQAQDLLARLDWHYPHQALCKMPTKFAVTELTHRAAAGAIDDDPQARADTRLAVDVDPLEALDLTASPAVVKGLTWHRFMEHLDLSGPMDPQGVIEQIETMIRAGLISQGEAQLINAEHVANFFRTVPGRLMLEHRGSVHRESAFTYSLAARNMPEGFSPDDYDEKVLLKGVIDCMVETPEGLVIIDYKTDRIGAGQVDQRRSVYQRQVQLYARAIGEITGMRVAAVWLYFSEPDAAVQVL
ncbi:MAG: helicase-exonuclease AddAB subunit AddA [Phycisphaerae bacterium]|nr:helicase-exonuclease AddAB subunit AddA [Phycisphaerae bacterium]